MTNLATKTRAPGGKRQTSVRPLAGRKLTVYSAQFGAGSALALTVEDWATGKRETVEVAPVDRQQVLAAIVTRDGKYASGLVFDPSRF